jgi:nitroimidazol reductase NimA-like FMN-containing flavoprotein (pyridoxamine 5'-phosphate oxidase superfamily)
VVGAVPGVNATTMVASQPKETTMERHEIDTELNTPGAQELLAATSAAHLAYVGSDATPRVIPVGFWWTGEEFVISTATTSPKVAALSARPDVALAIDTGDSPGGARALSVRGQAEIEIVDGVVEEYLMAARKSMDTEAAAAFEESCRKMYPQMARIAIGPSWVRFYDFGAGRMPRFLKDLADQAQN